MTLSKEIQLITTCCRTNPDKKKEKKIKELTRGGIDWDQLLRMAAQHKVQPLLFLNLDRICPELVPDPVLNQLEQFDFFNTTKNVFVSAFLVKILDLLNNNGICAVPFKGPVIAQKMYGDLALRQFDDLDILISKKDVSQAVHLLLNADYKCEKELSSSQLKKYIKNEYSLTFMRSDGRIIIDLHWDISGNYISNPIVLENFNHFETVILNGKPVKSLPVEWLLFYLCLHGCRHSWKCLDWVCCISETMRANPAIDWDLVIKTAKHYNCKNMLLLGVLLAHKLLDADLPEKIDVKLRTNHLIPDLADKICMKLFLDNTEIMVFEERFDSFQIKIKDRLSDKIQYCLHLFFSPTKEDWKRFPLPGQLSFLHYGLRPLRLMTEFIVKAKAGSDRHKSKSRVCKSRV